jgi:serine/threonine protein kinase
MLPQLMLKNTVLPTVVLILTYGLYVPKSWRRGRRRAAHPVPLRDPRGPGPAAPRGAGMARGQVVFLLRQVCGAPREAHAAGPIHRDIKPSNIFAARRGSSCISSRISIASDLVHPLAVGVRPHDLDPK